MFLRLPLILSFLILFANATTTKVENIGLRVLLCDEAKACAIDYQAQIQDTLDAPTTTTQRLRRGLGWNKLRRLNCQFACAGFPPGMCFHLHPKCKSYTGRKRRLEQIVEQPEFHLIASNDAVGMARCIELQTEAVKKLNQDQTKLLPSSCAHLTDGIKFQCFYLDSVIKTVD